MGKVPRTKTPPLTYQGSLFGWQKPVGKVPISAERIREAKAQFAAKDSKGLLHTLRDINDKLSNFEKRISNGKEI